MNTVSNLAIAKTDGEREPMDFESILEQLALRVSADNEEFNGLADHAESLQSTLDICRAELKDALAEVDRLKAGAKTIISNAEKVQSAAEKERSQRRVEQAELRELRQLDPKRLVKVNKKLKANVASLKTEKSVLDASRKEALKQHKMMLRRQQDNGVLDYWVCPETNAAVRLTRLQVSKGNTYGGVPETPVLEYYNPSTGVSRQGTLNTEGGISWVSDPCELPPKEVNSVAKQCVTEFCERNKIKLPKEVK